MFWDSLRVFNVANRETMADNPIDYPTSPLQLAAKAETVIGSIVRVLLCVRLPNGRYEDLDNSAITATINTSIAGKTGAEL